MSKAIFATKASERPPSYCGWKAPDVVGKLVVCAVPTMVAVPPGPTAMADASADDATNPRTTVVAGPPNRSDDNGIPFPAYLATRIVSWSSDTAPTM